MGLTSFAGNNVQKEDVTIAKNYLSQEEVKSLNRIVTMYLDYAEEMANEGVPMHMNDWIEVLDEFLKFNRKDILVGAGKISHAIAVQKALKEYEVFDKNRILNQSNLILPTVLKKDNKN